jgi:hypothetical protein
MRAKDLKISASYVLTAHKWMVGVRGALPPTRAVMLEVLPPRSWTGRETRIMVRTEQRDEHGRWQPGETVERTARDLWMEHGEAEKLAQARFADLVARAARVAQQKTDREGTLERFYRAALATGAVDDEDRDSARMLSNRVLDRLSQRLERLAALEAKGAQ